MARGIPAGYGTTASEINADVRTLTLLGDTSESDWLLSLNVVQEGDRLSLSSGGPFRRPIRFTPDEVLAMQTGLAVEQRESSKLSADLAGVFSSSTKTGDPVQHSVGTVAFGEARVIDAALTAIRERRRLELRYAGEQSVESARRVVHPHEVVTSRGHTYIVAWCERADGWRRFRADRVIEACVAPDTFEPRSDAPAADDGSSLFQEPEEGVDEVVVRFSTTIARWIEERYPRGERQPDGSVLVTYRVASVDWLVRHLLQYAAEAEVVRPKAYREVMGRVVG